MFMTNRERIHAILNYQSYDRLPLVHFGFWPETLQKWHQQGHLSVDEVNNYYDGSPSDKAIGQKLGFDFNWYTVFAPAAGLWPPFEPKVIEKLPDGSQKVLDRYGVIVIEKPGVVSIPAEFDHLLKDRESWERYYLPKLQFSGSRIDMEYLDRLKKQDRTDPLGLHLGSLIGEIRNWLGVEGVSYLYVDDEKLFDEIINTVAELSYRCAEKTLAAGTIFDFAHFWEDICFKNGPLIMPSVFAAKVGPYYKRLTDLVRRYGIEIVSLDCDGLIDSLVPIWLENGVNTMFPIEVGTWNASIEPWRQKYGRIIRGVGGMNKTVFSQDYAAIDAEVERLIPLVDLGGYIPCPDHRIAPDAKWENVQCYCEKMRKMFC